VIGNRFRPVSLTLLLLLAGCAQAPSKTPAAVADATPATPASESPTAAADKELAARLMSAEFAWQDGRSVSAAKHYARAAQLTRDPKIVAHATRVAIVAKQWDLAEQNIARWQTLAPDDAALTQARGNVALGQGQLDQALEQFDALLRADVESGRRLIAQGLIAAATTENAGRVLQAYAEREAVPGGMETLLLFGQVALQIKNPELAQRYADRAVAAYPKAPGPWFWRGHLHVQSKAPERARADFEQAIALDPKNKEYRLTYAALLGQQGDDRGAVRALGEIAPDDDVLAARAAYAARANDSKLMTEVYDALAALPDPQTDARLELLGQMSELLGKREQALAWYREVPRGERYLDAQLRIPVLLDDLGQRAEAIAHIDGLRRAGIDSDEKLADTFVLEAELHSRHEDPDAAAKAYDRGLIALPDERRLLYGRALLNEGRDHVEDAIRDLRRIVATHPEDPDALNALGYTLADRTDHFDEALPLIEQALKLKPDEPSIIDSMGWVLYRLGRLDEAASHLRRAYELQPGAEIAAHLGEVLWQQGKRDEARKVWEAGKAIEAENETLVETVRRLVEQK
jgi:tetratricopeptide (TPR) repeat protein